MLRYFVCETRDGIVTIGIEGVKWRFVLNASACSKMTAKIHNKNDRRGSTPPRHCIVFILVFLLFLFNRSDVDDYCHWYSVFPSGDARHQFRTYNGSYRTMVTVPIISHAFGLGRKSTCVFHACPSSLIFVFRKITNGWEDWQRHLALTTSNRIMIQ